MKTLGVRLTGDERGLVNALTAGGRAIGVFGNQFITTAGAILRSATGMQLAIVTAAAAVAVGLTMAIAPAMAFETQMRNVNSILHLSERGFTDLADDVLQMSREFPQSAEVMARGLYDVASAGFDGREGLLVMEAATRAASAGMTDVSTSAKAITAVLNAYGLEATHAADVSDVLFQTVNLGIVTFEELAQQLGDFVGIAAAAGVAIDDLLSAYAAITLAGVPPAEAGTSLNRVIQSLIEPSEALKTTFKSLGLSQAGVLDTLAKPGGLNEIMNKLREATGGNVAALLQLFPEIRAARGAFALMAAAGENYNRTQREISDEARRAGATQKAFSEQMKAASNQLKVLGNDARATGIEIGNQLLGPAKAGITVLQGLATAGREATGFLIDHKELVMAVGLAYASRLVMPIGQAILSLGAWIATARMGTIANGDLATSTRLAGLSFRSMAGFVAGAGVALAGAHIVSMLNQAKDAAAAYVEELKEGLDITSDEGWQQYNDRLRQQIDLLLEAEEAEDRRQAAAQRETGGGSGAPQGVVDVFRTIFDPNFRKRRAELDALSETLENNSIAALNLQSNITEIAKATGTIGGGTGTNARLKEFAKAAGADLSGELKNSEPERQKVIDYMNGLAAETGLTVEQIGALGPAMIENMQEAEAAAQKAAAAVSDFYGLLGQGFELGKQEDRDEAKRAAEDDVKAAEDRLAEAREREREASRYISMTPERQRDLAEARREVADAEREVADARKAAADATRLAEDPEAAIAEQYDKQIAEYEKFLANIAKAAEMEVDPLFLWRAMADPEQYGPILQAIVDDTDGTLRDTINASEARLRELTATFETQFRMVGDVVSAEMDKIPGYVSKALHDALSMDTGSLQKLAWRIGNDIRTEVVNGVKGKEEPAGSDTKGPAGPAGPTGPGDVKGPVGPIGPTGPSEGDASAASGAGRPPPEATEVRKGVSGYYYRMPDGQWWYVSYDGKYRHPWTGLVPAPAKELARGDIMPHVATTETVLYGERSTGGEAFIPLGPQHRDRSRMLLGEVAHMFGHRLVPMATGGIIGGTTHHYATGPQHVRRAGDIKIEKVIANDWDDFQRQLESKQRVAALVGDD